MPKPPASPWKKTLFFVWLSQFLSIAGFGFGIPFAAYYIQELGIHERGAVKLWTALFQASAPLTLALMSPVWGMLADRYGRKLMMLRANFGAALIIFLMGCAPNVYWLIVLRLLQGMFTGTVTAAQTLVAVATPEGKQGVALGTLSTAVFSGFMAGAFFGGICAEAFGYGNAFKIGAGALLVSGLIILLAVQEDFTPPAREARGAGGNESAASGAPGAPGWRRLLPRLPRVGTGLPLLVLIAAMAFARRLDMPILPLFIQDLNHGIDGAAALSGALAAVGSLALIISGVIMGHLVDRFPAPLVARAAALATAVFALATAFAPGLVVLFAVRFCMLFCVGGLDPVFQVWLSRSTSPGKRGGVFGWAVTAKSLAWMSAPLCGVALAALVGGMLDPVAYYGWRALLIRPETLTASQVQRLLGMLLGQHLGLDLRVVFLASAVAFVGLIPLVRWATARMLARK